MGNMASKNAWFWNAPFSNRSFKDGQQLPLDLYIYINLCITIMLANQLSNIKTTYCVAEISNLANSILILTLWVQIFVFLWKRSGVAKMNSIESASLQGSPFAASKKTKIGKCRLERRFSAYFSFAYKTIVK